MNDFCIHVNVKAQEFFNQPYTRTAHNRLTSRRLGSVIAVINIKRSITTRKGNICARTSKRERY